MLNNSFNNNQSYLNLSQTLKKGIYFYNRTDVSDILNKLSPIRAKLTKMIPYLNFLGMIANVICIVVFVQKKNIRKKSIVHLICLAISDFSYNFFYELPHFLMATNLLNHNLYKRDNLSCFFYDYAITTFHFYSVLITLHVTVERFKHIYQPLKYMTSSNVSLKSKFLIGLLLFFLALILAIPHGVLMVYNEHEKDCDARPFFVKI